MVRKIQQKGSRYMFLRARSSKSNMCTIILSFTYIHANISITVFIHILIRFIFCQNKISS